MVNALNKKATPVKSGVRLNEADISIVTFKKLINDTLQIIKDLGIQFDQVELVNTLLHPNTNPRLSEHKARFMNILLFALAIQLGITGSHVDLFGQHIRASDVRSRNIRKEYGPILFQNICEKIGIDLEKYNETYHIVPSYGVVGKSGRWAYNIVLTEFNRVAQSSSNDKIIEILNSLLPIRRRAAPQKYKSDINDEFRKKIKFELSESFINFCTRLIKG